ncbi:E3 ubiquitin-protein ligase TRIM21-like [Dendrobates tinctorius]|uniref:E3 ubiquitin-protein ligase TRIM21-like n=1 Tax=Dendrobates tinctorius TaxID=92724 RepID=UPI003CCA1DEC
MALVDLADDLKCAICLTMYTDPVTLTCGHSFCQICLLDLLYSQDTTGDYSCPECRTRFNVRPAVQKNTDLSNIVERIRCEQQQGERLGTCSLHKRPLEYYCWEDSARICTVCRQSVQHQRHEILNLDVACEKKKAALRNILGHLVSGDEEEREAHCVHEDVRKMKEVASTIKESCTVLIQEFRDELTVLERTIHSEISKQEEQVSSSMFQKLNVKKDDRYSKVLYLEELSNMTDHLTLLQAEFDGLSLTDEVYNGGYGASGGLDEDLISVTLHTGIADIVNGVTGGIYVPGALAITLNNNTAGSGVNVSDDLKMASWSGCNQDYSQNLKRFEYNQVLSVRSFCKGRQFWEVETSETGNWMIGMAYASIDRLGHESLVGDNKKSWCLRRYDNEYSVSHDKTVSELSCQPSQNTLRIYLDYEAGQLSFYEIGSPTRHLHTFSATFMEPLHVIIWVWSSWVKIKS